MHGLGQIRTWAGSGAFAGVRFVDRVGINIFEIVFEPLSDCFSVLVDDQSLPMSQHECSLVAQRARWANVQNLIWINKDFLTAGR